MQDEITQTALAVAMDIFELFALVDDTIEFNVNKATDLIEAYAARRVREARRPRRGKVVSLRLSAVRALDRKLLRAGWPLPSPPCSSAVSAHIVPTLTWCGRVWGGVRVEKEQYFWGGAVW